MDQHAPGRPRSAARLRAAVPWLLLLLALPPRAQADDTVSTGGHVKVFGVVSFPYDHMILPDDPAGQAVIDGRWKLEIHPVPQLKIEVHPTATLQIGSGSSLSTGVGRTAPEAIPLSWTFTQTESLTGRFRTDRFSLALDLGRFRFTLGRQPVTFGQGQFFTPLDLVSPFTAATLDTSYKPGVDAVRADVFIGMAGQISLLGAYLGDWGWQGSALAAHAQFTIVTVDVAGFVAAMYGEPVLGLSVYAPIGPIGLYGDVSVTVRDPKGDPDPFVRGVVGVFAQPGPTTTISAEVYGQSIGRKDPGEYLVFASGERFARGELSQMGHLYAALLVSQELTPLWRLNGVLLANLLDPSVLVMPSMSWSVASNADLAFGAQIGIGERPVDPAVADLLDDDLMPLEGNDLLRALGIQSEYGLVPVTMFLQGGFHF